MKIPGHHKWLVTPQKAVAIQRLLQKRINTSSYSGRLRYIAGADVSFSRQIGRAYGAVCILSFPDLEVVEQRTATLPLRFPYVPGLLTFREGPVLLKCFKRVQTVPDVVLFDGQGILHPRRMGIAAHLGILLDIPAIGCAKSRLFGSFNVPDNARGSYEYVRDKNNEICGVCLRTRENIKPVFISTGNKISLLQAIDIVLQCAPRYRIPQPVRCAHRLAQMKKLSL